MAEIHDALCDGSHTNRQACNRALSVARPVAASGTDTVLEAPPAAEDSTRDSISETRVRPVADAIQSTSTAASVVERNGIPAPSPWAVRAWEDTAAAVGATASPAPPPRDPELDDDRATQQSLGHVPLLIALAGATTLVVLLARRRRK